MLSKLALFTPLPELVDAYLAEIARGYGVPYALSSDVSDTVSGTADPGEADVTDDPGDVKTEEDGGSAKDNAKVPAEKEMLPRPAGSPSPSNSSTSRPPTVVKKRTEVDELAARFERLKNLR